MQDQLVGVYHRIVADPDIQNPDDFVRFIEAQTAENPSMFHIEEMHQFEVDPMSRRPGMTSGLKANDSLRNTPNERGNFEVWNPDSIPLSVYHKMSRDPDIKFATLLLKGWIAGLQYSIDCDNDVYARVVDHAIRDVYNSTVRNMLSAIAYGFAFGEKVWDRSLADVSSKDEPAILKPAVVLRKIKFIDPRADVRFFKNQNDELDHVTQQQLGQVVKVKRSKLVWFAVDQEFSCLFGNSRYKIIYDDWYHGNVNKQQLLRHVQRTGSPPLKVRFPDGKIYDFENGTSIKASSLAKSMAKTYLNQGLILLPSERDDKGEFVWDMFFEKVDNTDTTPFTNVMELLTRRKAKGIGVPPGMATGASNLGDANTQSDALIIVVEDLVDQIQDVFQKDIIDHVVEMNFGPEAVSSVRFRIEKSGLGRRKLFKEIFINVLRTMMSKDNFVPENYPDVLAMGEEIGVPMRLLVEQVREVETEKDGASPAAKAQEVEDGNDPAHQRPNETDRDNPTKRPSDATGAD
jgi:hypothetical protein